MKNSIVKAFINVSFWTFVSRVFGFIRDVFLAASIGAGPISDAFFVAFKLPNMFRRLTAEGALVQSFLPTFTFIEEQKSKEKSQELASNIQSVLLIFLLILLVLAEIFMGYIIMGLAPGFLDDPKTYETTIQFSRITIVYLPLISIIALWGSILQSTGKFMPLAASPIILNISLIACSILIISNYLSYYALAISVPIAGILQMVFISIWLVKDKRVPKLILPKRNINFHGVWKKFIPASFGAGLLQINLLVDTILASIVGASSVSYLYYADRLSQLPLGVIGIALGTALLPSLSKAEANNNINFVKEQLEKSLIFGAIFSIPSCAAFLILPSFLIEAVYARGEFDEKDVFAVALALSAYGMGVPAFIGIKVLQPSFYAMRDTVTPFRISIFSVILNITLSILLMKKLGFYGVALATSISSYITFFCLFFLLFNKNRLSLSIIRPILLLLFLGLIFGLLLFQFSLMFDNMNLLLSLLIIMLISIVTWFGLMVLFGFVRITSIIKYIRN